MNHPGSPRTHPHFVLPHLATIPAGRQHEADIPIFLCLFVQAEPGMDGLAMNVQGMIDNLPVSCRPPCTHSPWGALGQSLQRGTHCTHNLTFFSECALSARRCALTRQPPTPPDGRDLLFDSPFACPRRLQRRRSHQPIICVGHIHPTIIGYSGLLPHDCPSPGNHPKRSWRCFIPRGYARRRDLLSAGKAGPGA